MLPCKLKKSSMVIAVFIPVVFILASMTALAALQQQKEETPELKGMTIANENDRRDMGWLDNSATVEMIMKNKQGQTNSRLLRVSTIESVESGKKVDGDKVLINFDSPLDVKGTAFLAYAHKDRDDDQWLYLPAVKRVKRISSRNKSGSFVGSEYAYEDISSEEVEKYSYKWIGDEKLEGVDCFMVERKPIDNENTGYKKHVVWFDKAEYRIQKIDYYDRKNMLLKTLTFRNYQHFLNQFWRPEEMYMVNHQNGKSTLLKWNDRKFRCGLTAQSFNINSLKRSR